MSILFDKYLQALAVAGAVWWYAKNHQPSLLYDARGQLRIELLGPEVVAALAGLGVLGYHNGMFASLRGESSLGMTQAGSAQNLAEMAAAYAPMRNMTLSINPAANF